MYKHFHDREALEDYYEEMMLTIGNAGYSGVDVTYYEAKFIGVDYIKRVLEKNDLSVSSFIYSDKFAKGDDGLTERIEQAKQAIDTAKELETSVFMLVPIAHEGIENELPKNIRANMIKNWIPLAAYAVEKGLHPVVEDTPDLRLCFCKAAEVKEVMDAVPGLELVYDSGNMVLDGEDPVEYVKQFAGRIGFTHLKDITIQTEGPKSSECMRDGTPVIAVATGTGMIDIKGVIKALLETGYTGGMTVEYAKHSDKNYPDSLRECLEYVEACMK